MPSCTPNVIRFGAQEVSACPSSGVGKNRASVRTVFAKFTLCSRSVHVLFTFSVSRPTTHNLAPPLEKGRDQAYLMFCNSSTQELATSILASRVYCSTDLIRPPSR